MSDVLIKVDTASKKFCRNLRTSLWYGLKDLASEITGQRHENLDELRSGEFWALRDVSFELRRGECLGLVGHNGAGKTTLLRLLNGLIRPDAGRIEVAGRVGALIALGSGFNPVLTGRENALVSASLLGLSKSEIDAKLKDIVEFSEIGDFFDTPVQNYSSGMQVRLGFAIATAITPDVLIIDEILAVGDVNFRIKCTRRINQMLKSSAVILVTHDNAVISRLCSRAMLLDHGNVQYLGDQNEVLNRYAESNRRRTTAPEPYREIGPVIREPRLALEACSASSGDSIVFRLTTEFVTDAACGLTNINLVDLAETVHAQVSFRLDDPFVPAGTNEFIFQVGPLHLHSNRFAVNFVMYAENNRDVIFYSRNELVFDFSGHVQMGASYYPPILATHSRISR
jgi:lipopolysaccharide transport system ATP-binding protein